MPKNKLFTSSKQLMEEAKKGKAFWVEGFRISLEEAVIENANRQNLSDEEVSKILGMDYFKFLRGEYIVTEELLGKILLHFKLGVVFKNER